MRRGPTPFQEVAIFPDYHKMSSSIETVTAEAVTSRLNRMSNSAREPYIWNDQSMQEEANEFHQCKALFVQAPYHIYYCWEQLEYRYVKRKLRAYVAHIKKLCLSYGIAVEKSRSELFFIVPWTTWRGNEDTLYLGVSSESALAILTTGRYYDRPVTYPLVVPPAVYQEVIAHAIPLFRQNKIRFYLPHDENDTQQQQQQE